MVDKPPFSIPTELRDLTEQCIKVQASYGQLMHLMTQAIVASSGAPSNRMTAGFREIQERAVAFAKENAGSSFALTSELANAKTMQDVLSIQSRYAQTQIQTYARQVQELSKLTGETLGGSVKKT